VIFLDVNKINSQITELTDPLIIDMSKSTIRTRFSPPKDFVWEKEEEGSFGEYLNHFELYPAGFPVRDFRMIPIKNQKNHIAILKIDVGDKNLQQCADAWIRLYAEYLWKQKRFNEIGFHLTSGQFLSWNDYKNGMRTKEINKKVRFIKTTKKDSSYENFRKYLTIIFQYAGTVSLDKECTYITKNNDIKTGDLLISPGNPGHSVFIVGRAKNSVGKFVYLLAESFMPAQDIHILRNPANPNLSPWYVLDINSAQTITAKYIFKPTSIKRFNAIK
jgi:hypothetical protein